MKLIGSKSLAARITVAIIGFGLITAAITATLSYIQASASLERAYTAKLEAVLDEKSAAFTDLMAAIDRDIETQAQNPSVRSAIVDFAAAWDALDGNPTRTLQAAYITDNPNPTGEKEKLDRAGADTLYNQVHAAYHPYFRALLQDRGYYDIFLFDLDGNLIYSVFKELDYATNLNTGQYASSDLGNAFRVALETGKRVFFDYAPYAPSYDAPASFIATPVKNDAGQTIGVLSYQMPVSRVNDIMNSDTGLGETGMAYAIGSDTLMRSDPGLIDKTMILSQSVQTDAAKAVLAGQSGAGIFTDFRGEETITAYRPVTFKGVQWGLLAQQNTSEALAGAIALRNKLLISLGVFFVILAAIGFAMGRGITGPIIALGQRMTSMARGDYGSEIPGNKRADEIGQMAQSISEFRDNLVVGEEANRVSLFKGSAFDGGSKPMMIVDRDLKVTFLNDATTNLFRENIDVFREEWPGFDPEKMIGSNIDFFHKNPAHQRRILSDPKNLPFITDIMVGPLIMHLSVSGVFDRDGEYVGNVLQWDNVTQDRMNGGILAALDLSQAMIEFTPDGVITGANGNFLQATGYSLDEIVGKHHRIFMREGSANTPDYISFWKTLGSGEAINGTFERRAKDGSPLWLDATYNAVKNMRGEVYKVVKIATDVTDSHLAREAQDKELARRSEVQNHVVTELAEGLKALAAGDLTHTINDPFDADYEALRQDFNATVAQLSSTIARISGSTVNIKSGSVELSRASDDLSKRTENQAASLEETAAALNEITTTVQQSAASAEEARKVVSDAKHDAEAGGEVVQSTVGAMGAIKESSEKISQIIGVIDEIAFQTNLLALNAGVEAARAGEAGRGFAVVASEVRALAQRSSEAAKDIKDLISASSQHVESGVSLVDKTGEALAKIVAQVVAIDTLVGDITTSAKEQATGLAEVNTAVTDMDRVTQRNAAMVEESTAACHALSSETEKLSALVAKFKMDQSAAQAFDDPAPAPVTRPTGSPVHEQQERAAAFFSSGSSALKVDPDFDGDQDWQEF